MEILLGLCIGVGLSAACGFRIFVPFLIVNLAVRSGHATLAPEFLWITSDPALLAFGIATFLEIIAYYIPFLDNLLDAIMTPAAVIAGSILTASQLTELSPLLHWALAIIAGGGAAGAIQGGTVLVRGTSTAGSGGAGNFIVSTGELMSSVSVAVLAIFIPLLGVVLIGFMGLCIVKIISKVFTKKFTTSPKLEATEASA